MLITAEFGLQRAWAVQEHAVEQVWWEEARNKWNEARTSYVNPDMGLIRDVRKGCVSCATSRSRLTELLMVDRCITLLLEAVLERDLTASAHGITDCAMVTTAPQNEGLLDTGVPCQSYFTYLCHRHRSGPCSGNYDNLCAPSR